MLKGKITFNSNATDGHRMVEQMVHGYATQDLDAILPLFDDNAVYRDMSGSGEFGNTKHGIEAIKSHFAFYFKYLMPSHSYDDAVIVGEGNRVCASWTLVLGTSLKKSSQHRVRGCDFFVIKDGKVVEKCAFLKFSFKTYLAIARIKIMESFGFNLLAIQT